MDISSITWIVAKIIYLVLALVALWGAFCVAMVWLRVGQKRFRSEADQNDFLATLDEPLAVGDFDKAAGLIQGDQRAISQLVTLAIENREAGYAQVRQLVVDRFQRDILADLEYRLSWVNTVIKVAPMVGLFGTVIGMMGAFDNLSTGGNVDSTALANDISVALITTASGLAIAIPLVFCTASINVRIRKMEDLVAVGLAHFFDTFRRVTADSGRARKRPKGQDQPSTEKRSSTTELPTS